jgi:L-ascorbate metabolism protein UlaG (beta-lactamase superfamily)
MNPEEAVKAFDDLKGRLFIPMHYGTFNMSDEPSGEPIKKLREIAEIRSDSGEIAELLIGEKLLMTNQTGN